VAAPSDDIRWKGKNIIRHHGHNFHGMMRHDKNMFISYDINILYGFHYVCIYLLYIYMVFLWPTQVESQKIHHGELEILSDHPESFNSTLWSNMAGW
jgi:hypothetical protein